MNLFFSDKNDYLYRKKDAINLEKIAEYSKIYFPFVTDSEYLIGKVFSSEKERTILTVQLKGIFEKIGVVYAHLDNQWAYHPLFEDFAPITFLQDKGIDCNIDRIDFTGDKDKKLFLENYPVCQFDIFWHFGLVDLMPLVLGDYKKDILSKIVSGEITVSRRLKSINPKSPCPKDTPVSMPWVIIINNRTFRITLNFIDTSAVHGVASYADFCKVSRVKLPYKDDLDDYKSNMLKPYLEMKERFENYALGDLESYRALVRNAANFKDLYRLLRLKEYFTLPRLTIGSTVMGIFKATIGNLFGIVNPDEITETIKLVCGVANASTLKNHWQDTRCLNAKVRGGRCFNNRPIETAFKQLKGILVDIDISGCYGQGQRNQIYPFGNPLIIEYPREGKNKLMTVRKFRKRYGKQLVPGCWQGVVSTKSPLKYRQDFLASWIPPKKLEDIINIKTDSDTQGIDTEWLDKANDVSKIFNYEVINGMITEDFFEWLDNVCSPQQRNELLDKLEIVTAIIYPLDEKVNSIEELLETLKEYQGENETVAKIEKGKTVTTSKKRSCNAWLPVNMGDLLITDLLKQRGKFLKKDPRNTLFKLSINTMYGDMVSPYFKESNVVVGNNITARARALCWYMEKGFHGFQSITDGCVFDINRVPFTGRQRLTGTNTVNTHRYFDRDLDYKPLGGKAISIISWEQVPVGDKTELRPNFQIEEEIIKAVDCHDWIDRTAWKHLQDLFPNVSVLHGETTDYKDENKKKIGQFNFETKGVFEQGSFHGTANYCLISPNATIYKMRSYEKKEHSRYILEGNEIKPTGDTTPPSETFLTQLLKHSERIKRDKPFIKGGILKPKFYAKSYDGFFKFTNLVPGDTFYRAGMLKEFSLSQFPFKNYEQYKSWLKEYESLKRKYGQSFELYFINEDGTLDYQKMIETVDTAIENGYMKLNHYMDKNRHRNRGNQTHENLEALNTIKAEIKKWYLEKANANIDDFGSDFNDIFDDEITTDNEIEEDFLDGIDFDLAA